MRNDKRTFRYQVPKLPVASYSDKRAATTRFVLPDRILGAARSSRKFRRTLLNRLSVVSVVRQIRNDTKGIAASKTQVFRGAGIARNDIVTVVTLNTRT